MSKKKKKKLVEMELKTSLRGPSLRALLSFLLLREARYDNTPGLDAVPAPSAAPAVPLGPWPASAAAVVAASAAVVVVVDG